MLRELRSMRVLGLLGVLLACGLVATGAQAQADHLLLSKVVVMTRPNPGFGSEYVAITNPTASAVDLTDYYLTDATFAGAPYWELAQGDGAGGGGTSGDFNARFPAGTSLAAGETIVIAMGGSSIFQTQFGLLPDFELFEDGALPDDVPDLIEARPGGIGTGLGNPTGNVAPSTGWLDDEESLILYYWDGATDLVQDVDYLTWGDTSVRVNKTGLTVDGPDVDTTPGTYLADTAVGTQSPLAVGDFMEANDRLDNDEGPETPTGGNGLDGHDETSENLATTWGVNATMTPPVSGAARFATPVITAAAPAGAAQYENDDVTVDITLMSPPSNGADEMIVRYRVDGGAWNTVGAYPVSGNDWGATIPGQLRDVVVDWWVNVTGEEDGTDTWPSAAPFYYETYTVLAPVGPGDGPAHLLLTEVCVLGSDHEFIEIFNPTDEAVDLSDYYLTDGVYEGQGYWRLPEGNPSQSTVGGGDYFDFQARFPDGAMIQPGEALTISVGGSDAFNTSWGTAPTFEIREDGATADAIPDMREVFAGSLIGDPDNDGNATLTNDAEIVVLYYWDGASDLVTDIDMFMWGSSASARVFRNGVTIGSSTYADDTPMGSQDEFAASHDIGGSFQRLDDDETGEPATAGNGPDGHDETGEPLNSTWLAATGTPGMHGGSVLLISGVTRDPGVPQPDDTVVVTATITAEEALTTVDLHYRSDAGLFTALAMTDNLDDTWSATIPGFPLDTVVDYYVAAEDAVAGTAVWPAGAPSNLASYTVQNPPDPGDSPPHLVLSEVCSQGTSNEFVEIYNPTDETVELTNFYLTDAIYAPNQQYYWRITEGNPSGSTIGGGGYSDFHARFPAGAELAPGEAITVGLVGSEEYDTAFGEDPDYELFEDGTGADTVPDMLEVFAGSNTISEPPYNSFLSNGGEIIILYYWDGVEARVWDIDVFMWGSNPDARFSKTGVPGYYADTPIAEQQSMTAEHVHGESWQRLDLEEGTEPETFGNGALGHDETGENLPQTWEVADVTPGTYEVVAFAISGATLAPAHPQPAEDATITVSLAGLASVTGVTLHYALDGGAYTDVACADNGDGTWSGVIPGQAEDTEIAWYIDATGDGGETAVWPEGAPGTVESYVVEVFIPGEGLAKLLLTEVCMQGSDHEFVEIYNPNDVDVPLKNYYLTDAVHNQQAYWNLPAGNPTQSSIGGGAYYDFHARFPNDAVLAAGDTITVSLAGSDKFNEVWAGNPHYELYEDADYGDNVADMREVFPGSINSATTPTLSNFSDESGEVIALYFWDGISELVVDIDIFIWGNGADYTTNKAGVTIGGSTYANEAGYSDIFDVTHDIGSSYTRTDNTEGDQSATGGNGYNGADETDENFTETWSVALGSPVIQPVPVGSGEITLSVPARTFLPSRNERFPISFTSAPGTETVLRLFDLEGRLVRTLFDSRFDGTVSTIIDFPSVEVWDGRNDTFELVKAGMYIIHLQVTDERTGERTEKTAPAVVATRLSN